MNTTTFDKILDSVEKLPYSLKEEFFEIFKRRLIEERRKKIARGTEETLAAIKSGKAKRGSVSDLRKAMME